MKIAWRTTLMGLTSIVAAETRAKAREITIRSAYEANYVNAKFTDVHAVRSPEHDVWAEVDASGACWDEQLLLAARGKEQDNG